MRKCVYGDVFPLVIALPRGRVLLHGHLAHVGCVVEKVTQEIHGEVVVIEIDLGELGALAEGR